MDRFALFPSPVLVHQVPAMDEVNQELTQRLVAESENTAGFRRSNIGGWHSVPNLSQRSEACYRRLMEELVRYVGLTFHEIARAVGTAPSMEYRYAVHAWAMVMRDGDYTIVHDHAEAHWSVAYYPDAGDSSSERHPMSGHLSFIDPGHSSRAIPGTDIFPSTFSIKPRTGTLVVFPGWLQHYVHPYRGTRPRVCISANVQMEPLPRQSTPDPSLN